MNTEGTRTTAPTRSSQELRMALWLVAALTSGAVVLSGCGTNAAPEKTQSAAGTQSAATEKASSALLAEGQHVFRFETFGDEQLWTDKLRLNEVVEKHVDPTTALKVGLKVDAEVLPAGIVEKVDLKSPATTVALLKMNAVVGLRALLSGHCDRTSVQAIDNT